MGFSALLTAGDETLRDVLGESVTYTTGLGAESTVTGIFDIPYQFIDAGGAGISTGEPVVTFVLDDLASDPETDTPTITRSAVVYQVREVQKDGQGLVRILLHKV